MKATKIVTDETLVAYLKRLHKEQQVKKLGGGAFSQVFQHPTLKGVVTKVYSGKDKQYSKYVTWCLKNQDNPFVPKILDRVTCVSPKGTYGIVFMQKLKPIKNDAALARAWIRECNLCAADAALVAQLMDIFDEVDMGRLSKTMKRLTKKNKANPYLLKLWTFLAKLGVDNLDIHYGNAMMCGKQLVITDPVASDPDWNLYVGDVRYR
jgi:hypothetical protein